MRSERNASQVSMKGHSVHFGALGVQQVAPKSIIAWLKLPASSVEGRSVIKLSASCWKRRLPSVELIGVSIPNTRDNTR